MDSVRRRVRRHPRLTKKVPPAFPERSRFEPAVVTSYLTLNLALFSISLGPAIDSKKVNHSFFSEVAVFIARRWRSAFLSAVAVCFAAATGFADERTFRLLGRVDTDAIWTTQSAANTATFGDLGDVVGLRRARLGAEGTLAVGGRYFTELDFATGNVVVRDLRYAWGDPQGTGERRIGHFLEPFSLELGTSDNVYAFMERSPVNALDPERSWGAALFRESPTENSLLALGVFQSGSDANDFQGGDGSAAALTGRFTTAPILEDDGRRLLHLGAAVSERLPEAGVVVINQRPRSTLIDFVDSARSPFVPQIRVPADFQQLVNLQAAFVRGSFWTQAEWYGSWILQRQDATVFLHGFHAECGYFLTGEHRRYLAPSGVFGPIEVQRPVIHCFGGRGRPRGSGAWEIAARFAYLDFQDSDTPLDSSGARVGIRLAQSTFGLNWYLADQLRVMFNYSYAVPEEPNTGMSAANLFAMRIGLFW